MIYNITLNPKELKVHPINIEIYGDESFSCDTKQVGEWSLDRPLAVESNERIRKTKEHRLEYQIGYRAWKQLRGETSAFWECA